jgi:hypothetical protein
MVGPNKGFSQSPVMACGPLSMTMGIAVGE